MEMEKERKIILEKRKERKREIKKAKESIRGILLEQGFEQCKSNKGNLISQYKTEIYILDNKVYTSFQDLLKVFEENHKMSLTYKEQMYLYKGVKRSIRYKINSKSELDVVKKYTTKEIKGILDLYAHNINSKKSYKYSKMYNTMGYKNFVGSNLGLFELIERVLDYIEKEEIERQKRVENMMKELMGMF